MEPDLCSDAVFLPKIFPSAAIPVFNRRRRFSVDAFLSPRKCFATKRGSESAIETGKAFHGQSLPGYGSSFSKQASKVTFKQPCRFLQQSNLRSRLRNKDESFILVTLDNDKQVVISCKDAWNRKRALTNMMVPNVRICRLIVPSAKPTMSRKAHSCESLPEFGSYERMGRIADSRQRLVSDMALAEELYSQKLRIILEHVQELRKHKALDAAISDSMYDAVDALLSQSALLVQYLRSALGTWNSDSSRIVHCFSSTFWNSYHAYNTWYREDFRLLLERQQTDATLREFLQGKQLQGIPSLKKLLHLPKAPRLYPLHTAAVDVMTMIYMLRRYHRAVHNRFHEAETEIQCGF